LDKKQIELKENIKKVGQYKVNIELTEEVKAVIVLEVAAKKEEAKKEKRVKNRPQASKKA